MALTMIGKGMSINVPVFRRRITSIFACRYTSPSFTHPTSDNENGKGNSNRDPIDDSQYHKPEPNPTKLVDAMTLDELTNLSSQSAPSNARNSLTPPIPPDPYACCGNSCGANCVWTIYLQELSEYNAKKDKMDDQG
mmetsp:Transcript_20083/g.34582  ORF Transcript_20083/g.34582 Transcript_20083/m.34582 type:complete len:137 (-) Transcript_20083:533-943(-)